MNAGVKAGRANFEEKHPANLGRKSVRVYTKAASELTESNEKYGKTSRGTLKRVAPYLISLSAIPVTVIISRPVFWLSSAAASMLPLAVFAPKGMTPLFVLTAVAATAGHIAARRALPPMPVRFGDALFAFVLFAAASALWSLTPTQSFQAVWPVAGIFLGIIVLVGLARTLDLAEKVKVGRALLIGTGVGLVLLLIEKTTGHSILRASTWILNINAEVEDFKLKPATTIAAMLVWPILLLLNAKGVGRVWLFTIAIAAFGVIAFAGSDASILGLVLGGAAFGLALRWRLATGMALGTILTVLMIAAPWVPGLFPDPKVSMTGIAYLPNSGVHRILIWQTTAKHIHDRPWIGHGFDTSRSLYSSGTSIKVDLAGPMIGRLEGVTSEPIPLHPHNMLLQIWLELGAIGAGLMMAAMWAVLFALSRGLMQPTERAAGYGFVVMALAIAAVAYSAWQAWWLSALGLSAAMFIAALSREEKSSGSFGF